MGAQWLCIVQKSNDPQRYESKKLSSLERTKRENGEKDDENTDSLRTRGNFAPLSGIFSVDDHGSCT